MEQKNIIIINIFINQSHFFSFDVDLAAAYFLIVCSTLDDFALVNFNGFGAFLLIFELVKLDYLLDLLSLEFFFDSA